MKRIILLIGLFATLTASGQGLTDKKNGSGDIEIPYPSPGRPCEAYHSPGRPARAIRIVRSEAASYGLDPERIGIMGSRTDLNLPTLKEAMKITHTLVSTTKGNVCGSQKSVQRS